MLNLIALMMVAVSTFETTVIFYRRNIPQDSHLHIRRRENLISHNALVDPRLMQ
jgi:hypothetical protein